MSIPSDDVPERLSSDRHTALRIADANCNRVMEGLRTLEDIARFLNRSRLQSEYKGYRHALQRSLSGWDRLDMLASRDAMADVGRNEKQASEMDRTAGLAGIVGAATGRTEQGLRVLEEVAKFIQPTSAAEIESIRYGVYDSNAQLQLSLHRDLDFLRRSQLYVLVDCQLPLPEFLDRVREISAAGADILQVRDKDADTKTLLEYTLAAMASLDPHQTRLIVNDRVDVARIAAAWGVHVGQEDLSAPSARAILLSHQIVGVSTHDLRQVQEAIAVRADYIGCGPTFPSQTKAFSGFAGTEFLRQVADYLTDHNNDLPAFAIGGIHQDNIDAVLNSGFSRVAVGSAIWRAPSPGTAAAILRQVLDASRCGREGKESLH